MVSLLVVVSSSLHWTDPAPAGPPVAPPAVVAEASPDPALCALSRAPLGLDVSLLTALEEPAPPVHRSAARSCGVARATLCKCECRTEHQQRGHSDCREFHGLSFRVLRSAVVGKLTF